MIKLIYILLSILLVSIIINSLLLIFNKEIKNIKIKRNVIKNRIYTLNYIRKINYLISYIQKMSNGKIMYIKIYNVIIISLVFSLVIFIISFIYLKIFSSALILSIYSFFIPYLLLKNIYQEYKNKINNIFPSYIISLKNYTQVKNDIVIAFKNVDVEDPLKIFINKFNLLVEKGINISDAFEQLRNDINIKKINEFLKAVENCYISGGSFSILLDKYSKILIKMNTQKEKQIQENISSIIVLVILVIINIFLIINFIYSNDEYKLIIINSFVGKTILNINILSYLVIYYFINKLKKLEE